MPKAPIGGLRACALGAITAAALAATGCGDGPICPSEVFVVITSPSGGSELSSAADKADAAGVQVDVQVRSNLGEGETLTLTVRDAGGAVATFDAQAGDGGRATFEDVTIPSGEVTLEARAEDANCGIGTDSIAVSGASGVACDLSITEGPIENDHYAPLPVLNTTNDSDATLQGFQANIEVETSPGYDVELLVLDVGAGEEASAGTETAATSGFAVFDNLTLAQGTQALRAVCTSTRGPASAVSATNTVWVDTEPPGCTLANPPEGQTIIPELDEDTGALGTQVTLVGEVTGDDVSASTTFEVNAQTLEGTPVSGGESATTATFGAPGSFDLAFVAGDHAGNRCEVTRTVEYVTDGCGITHKAPSDVVTVDADGTTPGLQTELALDVDAACAGQQVITTCDVTGDQTATAISGGLTTVDITVCDSDTCETEYDCSTRVTNADGVTTAAAARIQADTRPPPVSLEFVDPSGLACPDIVENSVDVDPTGQQGVQIDVRALAPDAFGHRVEVTSVDGTAAYSSGSGGLTRIDLFAGDNDLVAFARDGVGNVGQSNACTITLADIVVRFVEPVADGILGLSDADPSGSDTFDICGTVSAADASMTVSIDGEDSAPFTADGNDWCLQDATLAEGQHTITATATDGDDSGENTTTVTVDLTPPGAPADLVASSPDRQGAVLEWTAPSDNSGSRANGYLVRLDTAPIDSQAAFDAAENVAPPAPGSPGSTDSVEISNLRAGTEYFFAVAAVDAAGNQSAIAATGASEGLTPAFDRTGTIAPVDAGNGETKRFGEQIVQGRFNSDDFTDIAVAAPIEDNSATGTDNHGNVYIYLGGPEGLASSPEYVLEGTVGSGRFGLEVVSMDWDGDGRDDVVVGAPFQDALNGRVFVFLGGARFDANPSADEVVIPQGDAEVTIRPHSSSAGFFAGGALGLGLGTTDFDGDGQDELVIGAPLGAGEGGAVVLFRGSAGAGPALEIGLSDNTDSEMEGALGYLLPNPGPATTDGGRFGTFIHGIGTTRADGGDREDVAVAYQANTLDPAEQAQAVYVWRGRASRPASGIQELPLTAGTDLGVVNASQASDDPTTNFGEFVASIPDIDGDADGARDIVITSMMEDVAGTNTGAAYIVDGHRLGTSDLADVLVTTIEGGPGATRFGAALASNSAARLAPDIDNDGSEDLLLAGGAGDNVAMYVWYGGNIPAPEDDGSGPPPPLTVSATASADHVIAAPAAFNNRFSQGQGQALTLRWAGDVNDDDLEDIVWSDFFANSTDGVFEVLFDLGTP